MDNKFIKIGEKFVLIGVAGGITALGAYLSTSDPVLASLIGVGVKTAVDYINSVLDSPAFKLMRKLGGK